ncbi:GyrI-like domain-containing protein [Bacillus sp. FSL W7-1360]
MDRNIEVLPLYHIAYIRQIGPYGPSNMKAIAQIKEWAQEKNLLTGSAIILGIARDNAKVTPPQKCRYDACIVLEHDHQIDHSLLYDELPGGQYMVFTLEHTATAVQEAWCNTFQVIEDNGYGIDDKPILERYTGEMIRQNKCEICVPVKPV